MHGAQLVVLAAGMGSRYGGLKQIEGLGPTGATLLEYSVFDALHSGFNEIIFIIRKAIEEDFKQHVLSRFKGHIPVKLVYQEVNNVPYVCDAVKGRVKPWGTAEFGDSGCHNSNLHGRVYAFAYSVRVGQCVARGVYRKKWAVNKHRGAH